MEALIEVDVQNDFCPDGALAVPHGDEVIEPLNRLAAEVRFVVATRDWHPPDHSSFIDQGGSWPVHCVRNTPGAELHPALDRGVIHVIVDKGQTRDRQGYSAFEDTNLEHLLQEWGVETVHVGGLALDVCVRATALDALRAGFAVLVHREASRAVEVQPGDGERTIEELQRAGVQIAA